MLLTGGYHTSTVQCFRQYHTRLSHVDDNGDPKMVDVTDKQSTVRTATAEGHISLSSKAIELVLDPSINPKGSVINVAKLAAIMATKKTSDLIPLCHNLNISGVNVDVIVKEGQGLTVRVSVRSVGVTGVEMEALVGVSTGLLTIYDMTKSVSHDHVISGVRLVKKTGGKMDK